MHGIDEGIGALLGASIFVAVVGPGTGRGTMGIRLANGAEVASGTCRGVFVASFIALKELARRFARKRLRARRTARYKTWLG